MIQQKDLLKRVKRFIEESKKRLIKLDEEKSNLQSSLEFRIKKAEENRLLNKANLSAEEQRYEDVHPLGLGLNNPALNPAFSKKQQKQAKASHNIHYLNSKKQCFFRNFLN